MSTTHRLTGGLLSLLVLTALWSQWSLFSTRYPHLHHPTNWASQLHVNPFTPTTVTYDLTVTSGHWAPDGVSRPMLLINDAFPGPTIEARVGDTVRIRVRNRLSPNTTVWDDGYRNVFSTKVNEQLPRRSESHVAFHWHGLTLRGAPGMDGAPGISSRAIPPGGEGVYEFSLHEEDRGTHWYHSHVGMQRSDGLYGAFVVHDKKSTRGSSTDDHTILLGDHYHTPGIDQLAWFLSRQSFGFEPTPDSALIGGRGVFNCSAAATASGPGHTGALGDVYRRCSDGKYAEYTVTPGSTPRLRLINTGAVAHQVVSVDAHMLTVVAADGTDIVPFETSRLAIAPGQRYDVLLWGDQSATSDSGAFWMRTQMDDDCFNIPSATGTYGARAVLRYGAEEKTLGRGSATTRARQAVRAGQQRPHHLPTSTPWTPGGDGDRSPPAACHDMSLALLAPLSQPELPPLGAADISTQVALTMPKLDGNDLVPISYVNRTTWGPPTTSSLEAPSLLDRFRAAPLSALEMPMFPSDPYNPMPPTPAGLPYHPARGMVIHAAPGETPWIQLVLNNADESPHPFHLHGHKFYVLETGESSSGWGVFGTDSGASGEVEKGLVLRDTVSVPRRGYAVVRWQMDNPGVWALHCHVLVHMASGMGLAVVDGVQELVGGTEV